MALQDIERGWLNLHDWVDVDPPKLKPGDLVRPGFELTLKTTTLSPKSYLTAMLTGDTKAGPFQSFYGKQLAIPAASQIAEALLHHLFPEGEPRLYSFEPNFLTANIPDGRDDLYYFEGERGPGDSATLLAAGDNGYLLLTNGLP